MGEWYGSEKVPSDGLAQIPAHSQLVLIGLGLDEAELRRGWAKAGAG